MSRYTVTVGEVLLARFWPGPTDGEADRRGSEGRAEDRYLDMWGGRPVGEVKCAKSPRGGYLVRVDGVALYSTPVDLN